MAYLRNDEGGQRRRTILPPLEQSTARPMSALGDRISRLGKARYYCVAFTVRCGSTALCRDLARLGLGNPDEVFQAPLYAGRPIAAYTLDRVERTPGSVFGFKLAWEQAYALCRNLSEQGDPVVDMDLRTVFPDLRTVHMVRRDKVRQAISAWRSVTSGTWHVLEGSRPPLARPAYDFEQILPYFLQVVAEDWLWQQHFTRLGVEVLTVVYEDYLADPAATLRSAVEFIGAAPTPPAHPVERLQIMRDDWTEEIAARLTADLYAPRHPLWVHQQPPPSIPYTFAPRVAGS